MTTEQIVLFVTMAAAVSDLLTDRISNMICAAGLLSGFVLHVSTAAAVCVSFTDVLKLLPAALLFFAAGAGLPFVLGFPLFRFRMIGAGDIKLLMAVGGLIGPVRILKFSAVSIAFGGVIAVFIMIFVTGILPRIRHFVNYIIMAGSGGEILPYRDAKEAEFHFAVPVFMSAVVLAAGFF